MAVFTLAACGTAPLAIIGLTVNVNVGDGYVHGVAVLAAVIHTAICVYYQSLEIVAFGETAKENV